MKLLLTKHLQETEDIDTFVFTPEEPISFQPGQYLRYVLDHPHADERGIKRYFSIASAPSERTIQLTTRFAEKSSSFKLALRKLKPGSEIEAMGPMGDFTYPHPEKQAVFLAGGIGITPFRSILVELAHNNTFQAPITLLYANRTGDIAFRELFDKMALEHPQFKVIYVVSDDPSWTGEKGRINEDLIHKYVPDLQTPLFYVSGPEPMVEAMSAMLQGINIPKSQIEEDFFPGYED